MNYAEELFATFIEKHAKTILDFIKISEKAKKVTDKNPKLDPTKYYISNSYVQIKSNRSSVMTIYPDGKVSTTHVFKGLDSLIKLYNEHAPLIMDYFAATEETRDLNSRVQEARSALAKCDI